MATRAPRKSLSAQELKAKLEKAKLAVKELEQRAYAEELDEIIKKQNIISSFNVIKANTKGISDIAILTAIGKACGIPRLEITQKAVTKRASKKSK